MLSGFNNSRLVSLAVFLGVILASVQLAMPKEPGSPALKVLDNRVGSLERTREFDVQSSAGKEYRLFVAEPGERTPSGNLAVLLLLDGNASFPIAVSAYRQHADSLKLVPTLIVGVGYPTEDRFDFVRRTYDYNPPADPEKLPKRPGGVPWPKSGGADEFLQFLQDELKPWLNAKHSIDPDREVIFGHSFGGLFVLHALFSKPDSFDHFIAASPSVWWNDFSITESKQDFLKRDHTRRRPVTLLVTIGELELTTDAGPAASLAPTPARERFGDTRQFVERLRDSPPEFLKVEYVEFPNESHGSVIPLAIDQAIRSSLASP